MISSDQFWNRLEASGFLPSSKIETLRTKITKKKSVADSALKTARALVANKLLTEDQARELLSGKPTQKLSSPIPPILNVTSPELHEASNAGKKSRLLVLLGLSGGLLITMAVALPLFRKPSEAVSNEERATSIAKETLFSTGDNSPYTLSDSPTSLWARPKPAEPIVMHYVPTGTQMIVRVRLAELVGQPGGRQILRSLGPEIGELLSAWTKKLGLAEEDLDELTLYLLPQGTTLPLVITEGKLNGDTGASRFAPLGSFNENHVIKLATHAIWCPQDNPAHFYYGPWEIVKNLSTTGPGLLRRELQQLHLESHDTDTISILANPNFLRDEAQGLFPNTRRRLLDGLFEFWSDRAQAVSLGYQQGDLAFLEIRMISLDDIRPRHLAARVNQYLANLPTQVRDFLGLAQLDAHWQPLAMRFPAMVSFVVDETRVVVEDKQVALTSVAPAEATHNLLLATELSLATPLRQLSVAKSDHASLSLQDLLESKTSVRFAQKSLEAATSDIAQQIREERRGLAFDFEIRIIGSDLELEGITRNQQIRDFDVVDLTLSEVLTQIAVKANPAQSVVAPNDANQKLVWIASVDEPGKILFTTRAAAKRKGLVLPMQFR